MIALAIVRINRAEFARIGNEDLVTEFLEQAVRPRIVRVYLLGDIYAGMLLRKPAKGIEVIVNGAFVDDFALRIQHTDGVLLVDEIETDGGGWNDVFHSSYEYITALKRRLLPSHLILFGSFNLGRCFAKTAHEAMHDKKDVGAVRAVMPTP